MSELIAIAYDDVQTARAVADQVGDAVRRHLLELEDMVVVERERDGRVRLHQPSMAVIGAAGGALWGGVIGLLFLPPLLGAALGAAAGAATGALTGAATDPGIDDRFLRELGEQLEPGRAALILLVVTAEADALLAQVRVPGTVIQTSLTDEDRERVQAALDAARRRGRTAPG